MNAQQIAQAIMVKIGNTSPTIWRVGLTHDLATRREQWRVDGETVTHWSQWLADSLAVAEAVESHFINQLKMKGGTGGNLDSRRAVYVYVF